MHLPDPHAAVPQQFSSFPAERGRRDVGQCIASNLPVDDPSPPDPGQVGDGPFRTCAYGPARSDDDSGGVWNLPSDICDAGGIDAFLAPPPNPGWGYEFLSSSGFNGMPWGPLVDRLECLRQMLEFLCDGAPPTPVVADWGTLGNVIIRFFEFHRQGESLSPDEQRLSQIFDGVCVPAFVPDPTAPRAQASADFVADFIYPRFKPCDENGQLLGVADQ